MEQHNPGHPIEQIDRGSSARNSARALHHTAMNIEIQRTSRAGHHRSQRGNNKGRLASMNSLFQKKKAAAGPPSSPPVTLLTSPLSVPLSPPSSPYFFSHRKLRPTSPQTVASLNNFNPQPGELVISGEHIPLSSLLTRSSHDFALFLPSRLHWHHRRCPCRLLPPGHHQQRSSRFPRLRLLLTSIRRAPPQIRR